MLHVVGARLEAEAARRCASFSAAACLREKVVEAEPPSSPSRPPVDVVLPYSVSTFGYTRPALLAVEEIPGGGAMEHMKTSFSCAKMRPSSCKDASSFVVQPLSSVHVVVVVVATKKELEEGVEEMTLDRTCIMHGILLLFLHQTRTVLDDGFFFLHME